LNIVIETIRLVTIVFQQTEGVVVTEVFKLQKNRERDTFVTTYISTIKSTHLEENTSSVKFGRSLEEFLHELIVFQMSATALLSQADVGRILQNGLSIGAHVERNR
jgi:hypothetical protein